MRPFGEAVRPLVPLGLFLIVSTLWVFYSPADVMNMDPRCVYLVIGTIFSNICVSGIKLHVVVWKVSQEICETLVIVTVGLYVT
jgi:ethanolaminephosphotransferase